MKNRRQFLLGCTSAALGTALVPCLGALSGSGLGTEALGSLSLAAFRQRLNSPFTVRPDSGAAVELVLVSAEVTSSHRVDALAALDAHHEKFILRFRGEAGKTLAENSYTFAHGSQEVQIFISPRKSAEAGRCDYEAVFNRPVNQRRIAAAPGLYPTFWQSANLTAKG